MDTIKTEQISPRCAAFDMTHREKQRLASNNYLMKGVLEKSQPFKTLQPFPKHEDGLATFRRYGS